MAMKTTGFNDLIKEFQNLDIKIQNQTSATAIDKASEVMLQALKEEAPKAKVNSTNSASYLAKETIKKGGTHQANMGINKFNWDRTQGLWYAYWGFSHLKRRRAKVRRPSKANQSCTYHAPNNWLDRGFEKSENACTEIIIEEIMGALEKK